VVLLTAIGARSAIVRQPLTAGPFSLSTLRSSAQGIVCEALYYLAPDVLYFSKSVLVQLLLRVTRADSRILATLAAFVR
jgi:hypothetical protein